MNQDYRILPDGTIDIIQDGQIINISQEDLSEYEKFKLIATGVPTIQKALIITGVVGFTGGLLAAIWLRK